MKFGYVRISTPDQRLDLQIDALLRVGVEEDNIYQDVASGAKADRKGMDRMLQKLRKGDEVIVYKLDRIARSLAHLSKLVEGWEEEGIQFKSISEPFLDTTSSHGKFVFQMFGAFAELERNIIRERTIAGLAAARKRGRVGGRKRGLSEKAKTTARLAESLYKEGDLTVTEMCEHLDVSRGTLYKYLRHRGVEIGKLEPRKKNDVN